MATAIKKNRSAPAGSTFVTLSDETATLTNSFSLGSLATGLIWSDVAAGVSTPRLAVPDTDYQSANANLTSISLLGTAADKYLYTTGIDTWAEGDITALARSVLDDATQAAMADTILSGAALTSAIVTNADKIIGQDDDDGDNLKTFTALSIANLAGGGAGAAPVDATYITQIPNGTLTNEQAISLLTNGLLKHTSGVFAQAIEGTDYYAPGGTDVAIADGGTGASNATDARTNLGLVIGTNVQAFDATLQSISTLGTAADKYLYTTGINAWAEGDITSLARNVLGDATQATMAATILSGAALTAATVANADKIMGLDADDADNLKTFTALSIAGLAGGGAGAAPLDATYITQTPNGTLTNEQAISLLSDGLLKHASGVFAQAIAGTDYYNPGGTDVAIADGGTGASTASGARTNLGLGTLATQSTINNSDWSGTDLSVANGGTGASTASGARTNLGLAIGTDVQAFDAGLQSIAGLTTAADQMIYTTGADTYATTSLTALARNLLDDTTQATMAGTILSGAGLTTATVATGDLVLIQDVNDSNNLKTVTAQSIADLGGGGTVTSVSGTAGRITSTGGTTPVIDIDTGYVGQTSITTLGTIATGTWQGAAVGVANGGTGASTASGARTNLGLGSLATQNTVDNGDWSGTDLSVANGGTGRSSHTAYAVICGGTSTTNPQQSIASVGTAGQVLTSNGAGALPTFQNAAGGGAGLVFLASVTISSDATVDFDNIYNSTYNSYRWKGMRIITATDSVDFNSRIGTGAGPTYQNGASDYAWSFTTVTTSASGDQDQSDSEITLSGSTFTVGNAAGEQVNFDMTAYDPADSSTYFYFGGTLAAVRASTGSMLANCIAARYLANTAVTSQQFFASSGNLTSGIIKVFGEVNS